MKKIIILLLFPFQYINSFIHIHFGPSIKIQNKELNYKINYNFSRKESEIINKINGFYGLIGPDVNKSNVNTLYDLFTGDEPKQEQIKATTQPSIQKTKVKYFNLYSY